jgi:uncharacterized membrane protein
MWPVPVRFATANACSPANSEVTDHLRRRGVGSGTIRPALTSVTLLWIVPIARRNKWRAKHSMHRLNNGQDRTLKPILDRNIRSVVDRRRREHEALSLHERAADTITRFTGSIASVYLHLSIFGFWIAANCQLIPGVAPWDESLVVLAMIASVEAIFLTTFVLMSQNRMMAETDRRADLDLQISLLSEHEITKLGAVITEIAHKLGIKIDSETEAVKQEVKPDQVLEDIERAK